MNCDICGIPRSVHDDHRDCVMLMRNRVAELEAENAALKARSPRSHWTAEELLALEGEAVKLARELGLPEPTFMARALKAEAENAALREEAEARKAVCDEVREFVACAVPCGEERSMIEAYYKHFEKALARLDGKGGGE